MPLINEMPNVFQIHEEEYDDSSAIQVFGHKFQVDLPSVSSCDSHCGHCSARMHSGKAVLSKHFIVTKFQYKFYIHFVVYYCRESNLYYTWFIQ